MQGQGIEDIVRGQSVGVGFMAISHNASVHLCSTGINPRTGLGHMHTHDFESQQHRGTEVVLTFNVVYRGF